MAESSANVSAPPQGTLSSIQRKHDHVDHRISIAVMWRGRGLSPAVDCELAELVLERVGGPLFDHRGLWRLVMTIRCR